MKKAFDQTVRDLKREVNKKVLKVPGIEQKVLDATSNEPWGPHGTLLAEIANASRNYHEYQLIMGIVWKRINDTGKNWRHVYKGLTVLEYLVANGSERVIDEIKEHAYQISTLSDFQYIDSSGKDQGNNVRKKSQGLVQLVSDKERIAEVRQKAAANRDKFRSAPSSGGMYRPNSYSGGYGDRFEDDRNGYGKDREYGYRDDDQYGRYGDSHRRDGDRYGRESDERYDRDGYKDDEYRGRSRSVEDQKYGSRSRSYDRERDRAYDNGSYPSRGDDARADDHSQDGRRLDRKFSDQNLSALPSYEEAVSAGRSPAQSDRGGETSAATHNASPPPTIPTAGRGPSVPPLNPPLNRSTSSSSSSHNPYSSPVTQNVPTVQVSHNVTASTVSHNVTVPSVNHGFDEFDPRGPVSAPPTNSKSAEGDFLADALALVLVSSAEIPAAPQPEASAFEQSFEDPFGETPFRATLETDGNSYQPCASQGHDPAHSPQHPSYQSTFSGQPDLDTDILAGILPLTEAPQAPAPPIANSNESRNTNGGFHYQPAPTASNVQTVQQNNEFLHQHVPVNAAAPHLAHQGSLDTHMMYNNGAVVQSSSFQGAPHLNAGGHVAPNGLHHYGGYIQRTSSAPLSVEQSRPSLLPQFSPVQVVPQASVQSTSLISQTPPPAKNKFETKSSVWADTLSRGLVNLNISGSKTNPLADIGVDFDALNRKDKRMEKPSAAPPISTVTMGKAMGSGSGVGRAGATAIRPPAGPMMAPGMGLPGYSGGMNQQSMGMNRAPGIGMNMGIGPGSQMQQPMGGGYAPQQPMVGGGYDPQRPMMGGGYGPQRPMMGGGYPQQPYNPQQPYRRGYQ